MDFITGFFNLIGSLICHQLPDRTLSVGGVPLPLCARDTGIYLGIFSSTLVIRLFGRFKADRAPSLPFTVLFCLMMLPMLIDGFGSYLGLFYSDNLRRLLTGAAFGLPIPFFLVPAANFKVSESNTICILDKLSELGASLVISALLCWSVFSGGSLPYIVIALIITASFSFLIGRIVYTIVARAMPAMTGKFYAAIGGTACVLTLLYAISFFVLRPLKALLLK